MKKIRIGCLGFVFIVLLLPISMIGTFGGVSDISESSNVRARCSFGEINWELWESTFERANVFYGYDHLFLDMAEEFNVDPVLFASIAFHETGWGTSQAIVRCNNPGGLMGRNGLMCFDTLEEGMRVMGRTLNNHINERGATTLEALRDIYAPLYADNDPNGLNHNWVPTITSIANSMGGLTMNCEMLETEFAMPVDEPFRISSPFGSRIHPVTRVPSFHQGIDFAQPQGMPVRASLEGYVVIVRHSNVGYGNWVLIEHNNGYWTQYAHLHTIDVQYNQWVEQGEQIGTIGSTGSSTGPHLHFEIRTTFYGGFVDPAPYLGLD